MTGKGPYRESAEPKENRPRLHRPEIGSMAGRLIFYFTLPPLLLLVPLLTRACNKESRRSFLHVGLLASSLFTWTLLVCGGGFFLTRDMTWINVGAIILLSICGLLYVCTYLLAVVEQSEKLGPDICPMLYIRHPLVVLSREAFLKEREKERE